ncbi:MAG: hypothetical protein V1844_14105 [Pseudomonadota bacterium]
MWERPSLWIQWLAWFPWSLYGIRVLHQIQGTISAFSTKIGDVSFASNGMTYRTCQKEGFRNDSATCEAPDRHLGTLPDAHKLKVKLVFADRSGILLGEQISGGVSAGELINTVAGNPEESDRA